MSTSQREVIELAMNSTPRDVTTLKATDSNYSNDDDAPANAVEAIPDGGYGWTVVFACSVITFMINGWSGSWGVLQTAVFYEYPNQESTTSLSFVGSLSIALAVGLGLVCVRLGQLIGARSSMLLGVILMSFGSICSSFTVDNLGGLFVTA